MPDKPIGERPPHQFVLKIEDGHTSWRLICPDDDSCQPTSVCGACGRDVTDPESGRCYDCPDPADLGECWAQSWVGEMMADEVLHGTVEVQIPVHVQWNGDGLEAHIAGPVTEVASTGSDR